MKADHEKEPIAQSINRCGVNAFILDYRVAPYRHPAPLLDAQRAIRTVRARAAEFGVNPARIAIMGFSAGGHLCAMAGTHYDGGEPNAADPIDRVSCRPDGFIPCYGVNSMKAFVHQGSMVNLTGKDVLSLEEARYFSSEYNVTPDTPPAFLWHTAQDAGVPVENSMRLAQALFDNGVPCALHVFPFGQHGIGLGQDNAQAKIWPDLLNTWLVDMGY
jgi:acetyl esterase/lipase